MTRLLVAVLVSIAVVIAGPFVGQARDAVREAFPGASGTIFNAVVAAAAAAIVIAGLTRIRERRVLRYTLIGIAVGIAALAALLTSSPSAAQNAVERFHFIEYGLVTWLFYRAVLPHGTSGAGARPADPSLIVVPALCALMVGTADEGLQWFVPERIGEWRDIFLNGTAIGAGLLFSIGLAPPRAFVPVWLPGSRSITGRVAAAAVVAIAAFVHVVHLGHEIRDEEIGVFRSRYRAGDLLAHAVDRAAYWAHTPPPMTVRRLSREDQYLAEAAWHVTARNAAWESDPARAWLENRILEKYFAPALDTPSYIMGVSRWPPEQREDIVRRLGSREPARRASQAARLELYLISPMPLWTVTGLLAMVLAAPSRWSPGPSGPGRSDSAPRI
jgi:hypothetical protein